MKTFLQPVDLTSNRAPQVAISKQKWIFSRAERRKDDDLEGKIADYTEMLDMGPDVDDIIVYYNVVYTCRAAAFFEKGDFAATINDYVELLKLDPENATAYSGRADARRELGDIDGAITDYGHAIRLDPEDVDNYWMKAELLERKGDTDGACKDYAQALIVAPNDSWRFSWQRFVAKYCPDLLPSPLKDELKHGQAPPSLPLPGIFDMLDFTSPSAEQDK